MAASSDARGDAQARGAQGSRGGPLPRGAGARPRQGRHHRQAPHGAEDGVPRRGRVGASREPTAGELRAWYAKNARRFALPGRASFRHLYFSPDRRGERARDERRAALAKLAGSQRMRPAAARSPTPSCSRTTTVIARRSRWPRVRTAVRRGAVPARAGRVAGADRVGLRLALVWVDSIEPGRVPAFEEVEAAVKAAWLAEQQADAWQQGVRGDAGEVHGAAARRRPRRRLPDAAQRGEASP